MGFGYRSRYGCGFGWRHLLLYLLIVPVIFYFACGGFGYY